MQELPRSFEDDLIIVTCDGKDLESCRRLEELGIPLVSSEYIMTGILQHRLDANMYPFMFSILGACKCLIYAVYQRFSTCGHQWAADLCLVGRDQGRELRIFLCESRVPIHDKVPSLSSGVRASATFLNNFWAY